MARHVVAAASTRSRRAARKLVDVAGRPIGVFNVDGEFFALLNRCPHQGGPLCEGSLGGLVEAPSRASTATRGAGEILRCPWHGWEFDIRTGQSWCDPSRVRVRTYPAAVETGAALVEGPYVAETFAVSVEDEYVVLDIN